MILKFKMMVALRVIYLLNIIVAGTIAFSCISNPKSAAASVFSNAYPSTEIIKLIGCLWLGIAILSVLGLFRPIIFSPVLLLQLIYKGTWLLVVALPAIRNAAVYPKSMAMVFLIWVIVLPFVIPWKIWIG